MGVRERIDGLAAEFGRLDDAFLRYTYLTELGGLLPPMDAAQKREETLFHGCQARVWVCTEIRQGRLFVQADSDSLVMRGILYLLYAAYNGAQAADARRTRFDPAAEIGLAEEFSARRGAGIRMLAERIAQADEPDGGGA